MFNQKNVLMSAAAFFVILISLWGIWKLTSAPSSSTSQDPVNFTVTEADQVKGASPASASATLVEYSDLQCPACKSFAPLVSQLVENNKDGLRFVYRHFPLAQHQHARVAAYYAEAAGLQDAFFPMHDLMFANQDEWSTSDNPDELFQQYGEELELDVDQLISDAASDAIRDKVETDYRSGVSAGVNSTPTFYLNGRKLATPRSLEEFQSAIDEVLDTVPSATESAN